MALTATLLIDIETRKPNSVELFPEFRTSYILEPGTYVHEYYEETSRSAITKELFAIAENDILDLANISPLRKYVTSYQLPSGLSVFEFYVDDTQTDIHRIAAPGYDKINHNRRFFESFYDDKYSYYQPSGSYPGYHVVYDRYLVYNGSDKPSNFWNYPADKSLPSFLKGQSGKDIVTTPIPFKEVAQIQVNSLGIALMETFGSRAFVSGISHLDFLDQRINLPLSSLGEASLHVNPVTVPKEVPVEPDYLVDGPGGEAAFAPLDDRDNIYFFRGTSALGNTDFQAGTDVLVYPFASSNLDLVFSRGKWTAIAAASSGVYENLEYVQFTDIAYKLNPNGSRDAIPFRKLELKPAALANPALSLGADTGASTVDRITNDPTVLVGLLKPEAAWQYSLNAGESWRLGSGNSFTLAPESYALGAIRVRQVDGVGNISAANSAFPAVSVDTNPPAVPVLTLVEDSGVSNLDRNTQKGRILVSGLEPSASWEYSIDAGGTWRAGVSEAFTVASRSYKTGDIQVRQTDLAGNRGSALTTFAALTVDASAPAAPDLSLAADSGASDGDRITNVASIVLSGLEPDAVWDYSTDGGASWQRGQGSSFDVPDGSYETGQVRVRQMDLAGNVSPVNDSLDAFVLITSRPEAPELQLQADTGSSGADRITNNGILIVSNLEQGASWQFSIDTGKTWNPGSGNTFRVGPGAYKSGQVRVRQTNQAGSVGAVNTSFGSFTVDAATPRTPGMGLSGTSERDRITNVASIAVAGLEADAYWEYSVDTGVTWQQGIGSAFEIVAGSYDKGQVRVRQTDLAGNVSPANDSLDAFLLITSRPEAPELQLQADTGPSAADRITNNGTLIVSNLEEGAIWQFSLDTGKTWNPGSGKTFQVGPASYQKGQVRVRQINRAGTIGVVNSSLAPFTVDTVNPRVLGMQLAADTGNSNRDRITSNASIRIRNLEAGATWEHSVDRGNRWQQGIGTVFSVAEATYREGDVRVRQIDAAGNIGASNSSFPAVLVDKTASSPVFAEEGIPQEINRYVPGLAIRGSNAESGLEIELLADGKFVATSQTGADGTFLVPLTAKAIGRFGQGQRTLQLRQADAAGNLGFSPKISVAISTTTSSEDPDILIGDVARPDVFTLRSLSDSLLGSFDVISNYRANDRIAIAGKKYDDILLLPSGRIASLSADRVNSVLGGKAFEPTTAEAFRVKGFAGVFLALNDEQAGFNPQADAVLFLENHSPDRSITIV